MPMPPGVAGLTDERMAYIRHVASRGLIGKCLSVAVPVCAVLAGVSVALEFGFREPVIETAWLEGVQLLAVAIYVAWRVEQVASSSDRVAAMKALWIDWLLLVAAALFLLLFYEFSSTPVLKLTAVYVATIQGILIIRLVIGAARLNLLLSQTGVHPARLVVLTFMVLIVMGSCALSLPQATRPELSQQAGFSVPRHILNCAFTATSATCVTGLVVYDTGRDFTLFGQVILLILIQAGGLGIMIFGSAFGLLVQRQLSLRQSLVVQDAISHRTLGDIRAMVVFIVVFTFVAEGIGACLSYPMWAGVESWWQRAFFSVFHAVSAFCNAGFGLHGDSMVRYSGSWQVYGCIMPLIVLGGLGFPVLFDLTCRLGGAITGRRGRRMGVTLESEAARVAHLSLHTKLVLISSAVLIVVPTLLFALFESFGPTAAAAASGRLGADTMAGSSPFGRVLDGLFLAVTCRTAGFNTVAMDTGSLSGASRFLACILMFIGGSPASTAGGVKTIGVTILALGVWGLLRGRERVDVMGRTIPNMLVWRAGVLVLVMFGLNGAVTMALLFTEQAPIREVLFEAVSACGTVGLSTGITPDLTVMGRLVIMAGMFAGRLGPLSLLIALGGRTGAPRYDYPVERVGIG